MVAPKPQSHYTILAPGFAKWWGSDARALAQAFRHLGHRLLEIDEEDYISWRPQGAASKAMRRIFGRFWMRDYNHAVLKQARTSSYDFILVFKGNSLTPKTIATLRTLGKPVYCFYPDVSFEDHGANIPASLTHYDSVFTTKSYHGTREIDRFAIRDLQYVRHGFDPEVHRFVQLTPKLIDHYGSDVSFVGCWSQEKEQRLLSLLRESSSFSMKVYGIGWNHSSSEFRSRLGSNLKAGVFGDELSAVYCASKINLGLLSASKGDASLRDQTTARTFQIPATKSFMLHEDTPEVRTLFENGKEVFLFGNNGDLVSKVDFALKNPSFRKTIIDGGHERCIREPYDYSSAARTVLRFFESRVSGMAENGMH